MSDKFEDVTKLYRKDVLPDNPRPIGLFLIPEYPEDLKLEDGMWSTALETILTTLRYLAPATLLTLFWGQQSFLFRILKHIDLAIRAIIFSSDEQKQSVLKWLAEAGPVRVEQLDTVWRHGWVLCRVLDTALPGACAGHAPNRQSLKHAQTIADHYLGVDPVFSDLELESNDCLSLHQEWRLATYLERIREALKKIPPPVSKPNSQRTSPMETTSLTFDYAAKGSGLTSAQVNNKMYFKIYPTAQQSLEPGEITILIRGPKDTYGMAQAPPILGKAQQIRQKLLKLHKKPSYTENVLPITHGATYMRTYGRTDMNKRYHIPKTKYDIEILVEPLDDCVKIGYIVPCEGKYEISLISRGHSIVGSPFTVTASKNILGFLERDSFCLEDGEEIDVFDVETDKKIVLRIVDFVTEKMLLRDDGALEKISDEEVSILMGTEKEGKKQTKSDLSQKHDETKTEIINVNRFKEATTKIIIMNKVCKKFYNLAKDSKAEKADMTIKLSKAHSNQRIPDVVNSTFIDINRYENQDPFNVVKFGDTSVSTVRDNIKRFSEMKINHRNSEVLESGKHAELIKKPSSPNNPFLENVYNESYITETINHTQSLDDPNNTNNIPIQIFIEEDNDRSSISPCTNPFIEPEIMERPKTPVLKIITGELKDREDECVYVDPRMQKIQEEILRNNEFINPFFIHKHHQSTDDENEDPKADFIIGAPVSLPPVVRVPSPQTMDSLMITEIDESFHFEKKTQIESGKDEASSSIFSTPDHIITEQNFHISSTFHSLDSIKECSEEITVDKNENKLNQCESLVLNTKTYYEAIKKDVWDSAYVSIDETNVSPDTNNNDNESFKTKYSPSDKNTFKREELLNMGPAELELWTSCAELTNNIPKVNEEVKAIKWETKRPIFSPIIEENDRSISIGINTSSKLITHNEPDPVTVAFAELNDIFHEYTSNSEQSSLTISYDDKIAQSSELDFPTDKNDIRVESASDITADVMRPTTNEGGGATSEVQQNVTESISASYILQNSSESDQSESPDNNNEETKFGQNKLSSIVLEKKKYWDEKIRQIEEKKSEEPKRKRLLSKNLRHNDSLSKRRGKQMVKHFIVSNENKQIISTSGVTNDMSQFKQSFEEEHADPKLVERRKKFWDEKLEVETDEKQISCFRAKSPKSKDSSQTASPQSSERSPENIAMVDERSLKDNKIETPSSSSKQELPEEMYKAFEISPKRFFGTSRKQILNRIDSFLGKPSAAVETSTEESESSQEKGIVSSRVSLFHNISQVEDVPWKRGKSHSLQSIRFIPESESKHFHSLTAHSISDITKFDDNTKPDSFGDLIKDSKNKEPLTEITLKHSRHLMKNNPLSKSFDEVVDTKKSVLTPPITIQETYVQKTIQDINNQAVKQVMFSKIHALRKSSVSKSEMDLFSKSSDTSFDDDLDKHKSYDELPRINVKNFISMYENVSDTTKAEITPKLTNFSRSASLESAKHFSIIRLSPGAGKLYNTVLPKVEDAVELSETDEIRVIEAPRAPLRRKRLTKKAISTDSLNIDNSMDSLEDIDKNPVISSQKKQVEVEKIFVSLSDMELEIISSSDLITSSPDQIDPTDYKSRFKLAKQYFQSIEELSTKTKKSATLNECEKLLYKTNESPTDSPQKKGIKKSHSMPSSELSKIWKQMNTENEAKLVKISEKFNVEDLFNDVMDGKLSRQGSLRGIPHKKAVLEAFKSMENVNDVETSSYKIAMDQLTEFATENKIKNAQTYLTEYPYLPTTDPSKYHSRLDAKAIGLISMKELLKNKQRRNSVPDLRLNPKFSVEL